MSGIVALPHPVPVRFVPPRSRNARLGIATVTTPVRLVEVRASEMRLVGDVAGLPAHEHGGHLWTPLPVTDVRDLSASLTALSVGPLMGRSNFHPKLVGMLGLTPLVALTNEWMEVQRLPEGRNRIVRDGTDRPRADLHAFLDGNVVLADGRPHVRIRGPLLRVSGPASDHLLVSLQSTWTSAPATTVTTHRRAAAALAFHATAHPSPASVVAKASLFAGLPLPEVDGLDDVLHFVATSPVQVLSRLGGDPPPGMRERLSILAERGMTGGVGLDEAAEAAETVATDAMWGVERWRELGGEYEELKRIAAFARGYVRNAVEGGMVPEDEAALDGMAP